MSTAKFVHPTSRREITRSECVALDGWLKQHGHHVSKKGGEGDSQTPVVDAWEHRNDAAPEPALRSTREEAHAIFTALFAGSSLVSLYNLY